MKPQLLLHTNNEQFREARASLEVGNGVNTVKEKYKNSGDRLSEDEIEAIGT